MDDPILANLRSEFTPEYREFVESDYASEAATALGTPAGLTEKQLAVLENGFMLYLHFVLSDEELVQFLITYGPIAPDTANELVLVFKTTLPLELTATHSQTVADFRAPAVITQLNPADEIAEMEAVLESMPSVRTMATDMKIVQEQSSGEYTSSQAAVLNRAPAAPVPAPDPDEARWTGTSHY